MTSMLLTQNTNVITRPFSFILGKILEGIFWFLGLFTEYPSAGAAIILMTIIIYLLLLPLTVKQQKFSKLSNKMNPELQAIRSKYQGKTDQDSMMRMNEETKLVYQKYGVNPSGSCIQLLIQLPILWSLYRVIYNMPAYVGRIRSIFYPLVKDIVKESDKETLTEFFKDFSGYGYYQKQFNNDLFGASTAEGIQHTENTVIDILNRASTAEWDKVRDHFSQFSDQVMSTSTELAKYNHFFGLNIGLTPSYVIKTEWASDTRNWGEDEALREECTETYEERLERESEEMVESMEEYKKAHKGKIDLMTQEEWDSDFPEADYEREDLYYFTEDDVLTNEDGDQLDKEEYLGKKVGQIGWYKNPDNEIYIRNHPKEKEYRVLKERCSVEDWWS